MRLLLSRGGGEGGEVSGSATLAAVQASLRSQDIAKVRKLVSRAPATSDVSASISFDLARALLAQREGRDDALGTVRQVIAVAEREVGPSDRVRARLVQATLMLQQGRHDSAAAVGRLRRVRRDGLPRRLDDFAAVSRPR